MRTIRRLVLLAVLATGGVAALNYWTESDWRPRAAALTPQAARQQATRLADRAATTASDTAGKVHGTLHESALTAKIKSKMALDDHVKARAIDVDTDGSVVTLTGEVASANERQRALRLAGETDGVSRVVDRLQIRKP
jgi:hyperosmotically inducible protein